MSNIELTDGQRKVLTEAAFRRLDAAREQHRANVVMRAAQEAMRKATDAYEQAQIEYNRAEEAIARGIGGRAEYLRAVK